MIRLKQILVGVPRLRFPDSVDVSQRFNRCRVIADAFTRILSADCATRDDRRWERLLSGHGIASSRMFRHSYRRATMGSTRVARRAGR